MNGTFTMLSQDQPYRPVGFEKVTYDMLCCENTFATINCYKRTGPSKVRIFLTISLSDNCKANCEGRDDWRVSLEE